MRDELTCWEVVLEFTGKQAALAIIGQADTDAPETHTNARLVLERMRHDYEETREWFATSPEEQEKRSPPKVLLVSTAMQDAREGDLVMRDAVADHPYSVWPRTSEQISILFAGELQRKVSVIGFTAWSLSRLSDFDRQEFKRDVLARWVDEVGATSLYPFTHDKKSTIAEVEATSNIRNPEDGLKEIQVQAETVLIEIVEHLEAQPGSAPAPGIAENTSNVSLNGISTAQVAAIFDGLPYTAENWPKRLSGTKWLKPAQLALGAAGRAASLWCPAILAQQICGRERGEQKQKTLEALNRKFKNTPALRPWRPNWDEFYSMFTELDDCH